MAGRVCLAVCVTRLRHPFYGACMWGEETLMYPYDEPMAIPPPPLEAAPRRGRRWLLPAVLALAFALTLGVGAFAGATMLKTAQAAGGGPIFAQVSQASTPGAREPGGQGQCDAYTVSSMSAQTITAKAADGSTVTIHTSSSTKYTKGGQSASASAVTAGSQIHVQGEKSSDGGINATQIDVR